MQAFFHHYLTAISEDTTIIVSLNGSKFHHVIMFVVTNLVTPQPLVCFTPPDRRWKIKIMEMLIEYLTVQIRKILMEIWNSYQHHCGAGKFQLDPHKILGEGSNRFQSVQLHRE
jgi:hypothetical protein